MKATNIFCFMAGFLLMFGCAPDYVTPNGYVNYFNETSNGLIKEQCFEQLQFKAAVVTNSLLAIKRSLGNEERIASNLKQIENLTYFVFKIHSNKKSDPFLEGAKTREEYAMRMQYANTGIQKDFKLEYNQTTIDCRVVIFEPARNLSEEQTFSLVFDDLKLSEVVLSDVKLIYDDKLFGLGVMKFNFKKESIKAIPNLKL